MTSPPQPRRAAIRILETWEKSAGSRFAEDLLAESPDIARLSSPDRRLVHAVVMAVLRNRTLLDFWIDHLSERPGRRIDPFARTALRCGLAERLILGIAPHAAVNETVEAVPGRFRGFVNALLRRADREADSLAHEAEKLAPEIRFSHPQALVRRWERAFGPEATWRLLEWNNRPAPMIVRINRQGGRSVESLDSEAEAVDHPVPAAVELLQQASGHRLEFRSCRNLPLRALASGEVYAQDPSTALAPLLLAPPPGARVLDACAAPGGKTAILAELTGSAGSLLAVDRSPDRIARLRSNLTRLGVDAVRTLTHDWEAGPLPSSWGMFDCILVDVPCSNTGVLRRRVDARWRFSEEALEELVVRQRRILDAVASSLAPGGRLVYSTCSIEADENENLVGSPGPHAAERLTVVTSRRLTPWTDGCDGAFAALFAG